MVQLTQEQLTFLSDKLDENGLQHSPWKEPVMERLTADILKRMGQDTEFEKAAGDIFKGFNPDILVDLPKINPGHRAGKIYRGVKKTGKIAGLAFLGLAVVAFILSLGVAVPLFMTGLFLFLFLFLPFSFLYRNNKERADLVYNALFGYLRNPRPGK
jgi:hypothetical protein